MINKINFRKVKFIELVLVIIFSIFSSWLMFSSFSYSNGSIMIGAKAWSDFSSTVPVIRSFSFGSNFPPEYPLFPGEPIHYHFLFYFLVGFLEKIGVRIDFALNIPSAVGFFSLLIMIYYFSKRAFKNMAVGILSVLFFIFNGSFAFLEFFKTHPLTTHTLNNIVLNNTFPSFGPYDGKIVSAFWNLNIFTNQRHLAFAFLISLIIIFVFINPVLFNKNNRLPILIILGIMLGIFFFFHLAVLLCTVAVIISLAIFFKELRIQALIVLSIGGLICFPQYLYLQSGEQAFKPFLSIGYLAQNKLTFLSFMNYWFFNIGFHLILIPLGIILATNKLRKIFASFFMIFIIGNLIQFSPDIAANHKFFNYFMLIGSMFSAFAIVKLWRIIYLKPVTILLVFFLVLSGIIDFFPIYNDGKVALADYQINPTIKWIKNNTPRDSVFLNSQYLYDPASLAGRKILIGWPYFPWSAGYNTQKRDDLRKNLLISNDLKSFCSDAKGLGVSYAGIISNNKDVMINYSFFKRNFKLELENTQTRYEIYNISEGCK